MKIAPLRHEHARRQHPCSSTLRPQAEAAKLGVAAAGGTPFEFTTISVSDGRGAVMAGAMTEADLASMELECSPTVGSCPGQFTANTMAMVFGDARPRRARLRHAHRRLLPAPRPRPPGRRDRAAHPRRRRAPAPRPRHAEEPRERLRRRSRHGRLDQCRPALARDRPRGGGFASPSTTSPRSFQRTPLIANLQPGGEYLARDLHYAGGVAAVLKALLDGGYLHGDALALSGRTLAAELAAAPAPDGSVVRLV